MMGLPHLSDAELIAELRSRGYRVYPKNRVRVASSVGSVTRHDMSKAGPELLASLIERVQRDAALQLGAFLWNARMGLRTVEDAPECRIYRLSVCTVLPNDFDFEREAWEVRHGERPVTDR